MLGQVFVYILFACGLGSALFRPYVGLLVFYGFVFLEPEWNWRWAIDRNVGFQKYLAVATIVGWFLNSFRGNRLSGIPFWACSSLLSFLMLAFVAQSASIAPDLSAFYMDIVWKIVVMSILCVILLNTPSKIRALMWVAILCQGYNAYQINLYYFQDGFCRFTGDPAWGYKGDNNIYSIFTIPTMAISLSLAVYEKSIFRALVAGGIFALQLHQIFLLESRGCMLGGLIMLFFFVILMPKNKRTVSVAIAGLIVGAVLAGPPVIKEFTSAFKSRGDMDSSASGRYELWKAGWNITMDYPLLGVGPYAGQVLVPRYFLESDVKDRKGLHNLIFEISTGCGLPALFFYLMFFMGIGASCWVYFWFHYRDIGEWTHPALLAVISGTIGYWASSMFSSGALLESSYALTAIGAATIQLIRSGSFARESTAAQPESVNPDLELDRGARELDEDAESQSTAPLSRRKPR